jgi:hypothetical protein
MRFSEFFVFENDSRLDRIEERIFEETGLKWILIPSRVVVFGEKIISWWTPLESFVSGSFRPGRIETSACVRIG